MQFLPCPPICASAATVDNAALEAVACEFESHLAYHAPLFQQVEKTVSKAVQSRFESEEEYHALVIQQVEIADLKSAQCQFESDREYQCPYSLSGRGLAL